MTKQKPDPKTSPCEPTPIGDAHASVDDQLREIARRGGVPIVRVIEEHAERAAIREYLGGMPRAEAEVAAIADTCDVLGVP